MQIFVALLGGRTRTLEFLSADVPVASLKNRIAALECIPAQEQRILSAQRELLDDAVLRACEGPCVVSLALRVCGGKGGFGSLLRGAPSRVGQKKTDNFDACRDLSGRRMRHANNEKKLAEWLAESKEREMEKVAQEYIKKISKQHHFDDVKYTHETQQLEESMSEALEKGMEEAKKTNSLMVSKKRSADSEEAPTAKKQRTYWNELDDIPEYESEPEVKEKKTETKEKKTVSEKKSKFSPEPESHPLTTTTTTTTTTTAITSSFSSGLNFEEKENVGKDKKESKKDKKEDFSVHNTTITTTTTTTTHFDNVSSEKNNEGTQKNENNQAKNSENAGPAFSPVDVSKYESAKELEEAVGADQLKAELQRLGLLCGGTPAERAARLFLLKTTPLDQLDKKHFAKNSNKKNRK